MKKTLVLRALLVAATVLAPAAARATSSEHHHHHQQSGRNVAHGTAEAFRTAGTGVTYGVRSFGRALTGRPADTHDRAKMKHHAHETRQGFTGH